MKEYIDKELFLSSMGLAGDETKYGNRDAEHQIRSYSTYMAYEILDSVDDAIAADVVERKRGEWVDVVFDPVWKKMKATCTSCSHRGEIRVKSNYCGFVVPDSDFCPNCGADMRVKEEQE